VISLGYGAYKTVTIHEAQVPSNQTQFPVLFTGTYSYLADVAHGGSVTNASGYDIIFSSTNNLDGSGIIAFERVAWNNVTGQVTFYFPTNLSSSADTVVYLLYGNSNITTDQSNKTAVWDANFKQVNHMQEASGAQLMDSTSNGNNSTANPGTSVAGKFGNAVDIPASGTGITWPTAQTGSIEPYFTFAGWIKTAVAGTKVDMYGAVTSAMYAYLIATTGNPAIYSGYSSNTIISASINLADTNWHYFAATVDMRTASSVGQIVADGVVSTTSTTQQPAQTWGTGVSNNGEPGVVIIQELRVSNIARTANWLITEYNNTSSPASFYAVA
jgi:hypothetical protein